MSTCEVGVHLHASLSGWSGYTHLMRIPHSAVILGCIGYAYDESSAKIFLGSYSTRSVHITRLFLKVMFTLHHLGITFLVRMEERPSDQMRSNRQPRCRCTRS